MKFKRILCAILSVCILMSVCACENSPEKVEIPEERENTVTFLNMMIGDKCIEEWNENNVVSRVSWNTLRLSEEDERNFPKLKKAFDELNQDALTSAQATIYELQDSAEFFQGDEYNPMYLYSDSEIFVQRADSCLLSYLEELSAYSGGAHSNYFCAGVNFVPETGEILELTDILTDTEDLPAILQEKLEKKYDDCVDIQGNQAQKILEKYAPEDYQWTVDYQGITFWFSPYELASFAAGTLSVKIYFDEMSDIFDEKYQTAPSENYVISLPEFLDADFDLVEGDGKTDIITIEESFDDYGNYNMLSVTVNGKTKTDEINYAYEFDTYLVHMGDKNYIYSDSCSDNDYHMFCTWDINRKTPVVTDELYGTQMKYEFVEEDFNGGIVYKTVFNNPSSFSLETRMDILGTRGATANYKASEKDGAPEMTDEAYTFNESESITLKIPLEAEILPDMGREELGEGMYLTPYRTDGETYVDLMTEDSWVVRFEIDISDWPRTVNGIPEYECFDNLMYAG